MGTSHETSLLLGLFEKHHGEKKSQKTNEAVHLNLLVCPVILRPKGKMVRILHVLERIFDLGLPPVGGDDLVFRPLMPIGDQNAASKPAFLQCLELILVDPEAEIEGIVRALGKIPANDELIDVMGSDQGTDFVVKCLQGTLVAIARWSADAFLERIQGSEKLFDILFDATDLPLEEFFRDVDHRGKIKPPYPGAGTIALQLFSADLNPRHGGVGFLDELLVMKG